MRVRKSGIYIIVIVIISLGCLFFWYGELHEKLSPFFHRSQRDPSTQSPAPQQQTLQAEGRAAKPEPDSSQHQKIAIPKEAPTIAEDKTSSPLPPSPPIPVISPQSNQAERRQLAGFKDSVDYIVQADEPFEVGGKTMTINEIRNSLQPEEKKDPLLPQIKEADVGPYIRKPIAAPAFGSPPSTEYYAVRIVQPGDNLWNIHYQIIRDYLARRRIILPAHADEPLPDGRSSGIGRLLKFIEHIVVVYNFDRNQPQQDVNLIHSQQIVVFFKLSDLLAALDQLQPEDLNRLRYVNDFLRLDRPGASSELLDRRVFLQ